MAFSGDLSGSGCRDHRRKARVDCRAVQRLKHSPEIRRLPKINGAKAKAIITTRRVSFEVALFKAGADQRRENTGDYHNPTRERGIFPNTASNAKAQSLADAAGWDSRKRATSKLTRRVVIKSTTRWTLGPAEGTRSPSETGSLSVRLREHKQET